ncbi:MAG: InlB B-repeat-containing protein [Mollicutes bacterium]|nr:InlB B-repeat-containing protein [Mollicutes bacterium]
MPSDETYTITLAEEGLDLNSVTYSKEVKFKVTPAKYHSVTAVKLNGNALTVGEDGYYLVKNQVFDAAVTVEIARNKATVTFNSNGGTAIEAKTIDQGTLVEEVTPTRAGDTYYDTYTFGGWYLNGKKFDFSTVVESDITLVAKWNYGTAKSTNSDVWAKENFAF